ncbi:MAG: DUF4468 domain-containing protein [Bacteroides sp.]|nr:DUF4468 domain-containing protein [Bacteroides sp.]
MKKLTHILFAFVCLCIPNLLLADDNEDSRYLAGAVPEVDGKVVFTKEFSVPGMSQEAIYDRLKEWLNVRLQKNENNSRVVLADKAKGQIVAMGDEWIIFSSTALSLDRTRITYQATVTCQPEKCVLQIGKIRYIYREGQERYSAEEWITDKYALNKAKTKLVRGLAKWRRKTVDFMDAYCLQAADALSGKSIAEITETEEEKKAKEKAEKKKEKAVVSSGTMVVAQRQTVSISTPQTQPTEPVAQAAPAEKTQTPAAPANEAYKEVAPEALSAELIQTGAGKLVIVIGEEPFNMTMMTANAGGSLGKVNGKPVVFTILSPDQSAAQVEKAETYTVRFYPNGKSEPTVVLECKKMTSPAAIEGMPRTFVGQIVKAKVKQ